MKKLIISILIGLTVFLSGCIEMPSDIPTVCYYDGTYIITISETEFTCEQCHKVIQTVDGWEILYQ